MSSIASMTGFGSGSATVGKCTVTAEITTVNRKQLEMRFTMPREFAEQEIEFRRLIQSALSRGMVSVRLARTGGADEFSGINRERARAFSRAARELGAELGLKNEISIAELLAMPGVLDDSADSTASDDCRLAAAAALRAALDALDRMRRTEGETLAGELTERIRLLRTLREQLMNEVKDIESQLKQRLLDKIAQAKLPVDLQDERFLKEVLFYADKADVTEELTRLASHFQQFESFLGGETGGGRSMDFLVQEMFREITTLGNKAGSGPVARIVVRFKSELEKIREQVQNIE